jgi:UDP-N-acetylmuramyl pentapeptide synthase
MRSLRKNDLAIFCADDETMRAMAQRLRGKKMTFGYSEDAKVRGKIFRGEDEGGEGTSFKISYRGTVVPFHFSSAITEKEVCAALAVAAVGLHMGFNLVEISEALRR